MVVAAALAAGDPFDPATLAAGLGLPPGDAAEAVRQLRTADLVRDDAVEPGKLRLTPDGRELAVTIRREPRKFAPTNGNGRTGAGDNGC